jgi:hypothetical protein
VGNGDCEPGNPPPACDAGIVFGVGDASAGENLATKTGFSLADNYDVWATADWNRADLAIENEWHDENDLPLPDSASVASTVSIFPSTHSISVDVSLPLTSLTPDANCENGPAVCGPIPADPSVPGGQARTRREGASDPEDRSGLARSDQSAEEEPQVAFIPRRLELHAPRPNPSAGYVTMDLDIPAEDVGAVSVSVFDVTGRRLLTLVRPDLSPGRHTILWDRRDSSGNRVSSGVYFVRMNSTEKQRTHKLVLTR